MKNSSGILAIANASVGLIHGSNYSFIKLWIRCQTPSSYSRGPEGQLVFGLDATELIRRGST